MYVLVPGAIVISVLPPSLISTSKLLVLVTSIWSPKSPGTISPCKSKTWKVTALRPPLSLMMLASGIVTS